MQIKKFWKILVIEIFKLNWRFLTISLGKGKFKSENTWKYESIFQRIKKPNIRKIENQSLRNLNWSLIKTEVALPELVCCTSLRIVGRDISR